MDPRVHNVQVITHKSHRIIQNDNMRLELNAEPSGWCSVLWRRLVKGKRTAETVVIASGTRQECNVAFDKQKELEWARWVK